MSIYYFGGYKRYTTDRKNSSEIINICTLLSLPSPNHRFTDFDFVFDTPFFLSRILEKALAEAGIEYTAVGSFGFIPELIKYKARIGIFIGALLLICFTVSSPLFLWYIDLTGNAHISRDEMILTLKQSGLYTGCFIPYIDTDKIENAALASNSKLSWISVNISGNTAYVEMRESVDIIEDNKVLPYANIIAKEDAIITDIEIFSGVGTVKRDTYVRQGEMLISGVISKEALGTYLTYARGNIYGKNFKEIEIEVPLSYEKAFETGRKRYSFSLNFFSKTYTLYPFLLFDDYSKAIKAYTFGNGHKELPISFTQVIFSESKYMTAERNKEEAKREGLLLLEKFFLNEYSDADILSKRIEFVFNDDNLLLKCGFWYEREIGLTVEFESD